MGLLLGVLAKPLTVHFGSHINAKGSSGLENPKSASERWGNLQAPGRKANAYKQGAPCMKENKRKGKPQGQESQGLDQTIGKQENFRIC